IVTPAVPGQAYYRANEIATLLHTWEHWRLVGTADKQDVLDDAKAKADANALVVAVWRNPDPSKPGHIVLIGPGPLTQSGSWASKVPVSAQFRQGDPDGAYLGKPLSCAFKPDIRSAVEIWARDN